jgi:hypothetical protein
MGGPVRAVHGAEHRAGLAGQPRGPEPARPEPADQRQVGQGLAVVHQRGPPAGAALVHRRLREPGPRRPAADGAHQRRGLPGQEPARRLDHLGGDPVAPGCGPVRQRGGQVPGPGPGTGTGRPARPPPRRPRAAGRPAPGAGPATAGSGPCRWLARFPRRWRSPPPGPSRARCAASPGSAPAPAGISRGSPRGRSTETAPTPSQNGWYGETNGTTAAAMPMLTNGSAMAVPMCTATNVTASRATLRCGLVAANRGRPGSRPCRLTATRPRCWPARTRPRCTDPLSCL